MSRARPLYSGLSFLDLHLEDVETRHPEVAELVGYGCRSALGDEKGLLAQHNGLGGVRTYAAFKVPSPGPPDPARTSPTRWTSSPAGTRTCCGC